GHIRSEGPDEYRRHTSWSVSYDVYVPSGTNLEAVTENGGIAVEGVRGEMSFEATNGGIHLTDVGGDVDARTTNGGATVYVPRGYNARLETGTTNGGMRVDFPITVTGSLSRHITTQLGSG